MDAAGSNKESAPKELLGDALRNAAMKFGIGLSLWSKSEWQSEPDDNTATAPVEQPPADPSERPFMVDDPLESLDPGPLVARKGRLKPTVRGALNIWCAQEQIPEHPKDQSPEQRALFAAHLTELEKT